MEVFYRNRLLRIRDYAKEHKRLPAEVTDLVYTDEHLPQDQQDYLLGLFFMTAIHWEDWEDKTEQEGITYLRPGMRSMWQSVDEEHTDATAGEFGHDDSWFKMPNMKPKRDWRRGIALHGIADESPLDVEWSAFDIDTLHASFEPGDESLV